MDLSLLLFFLFQAMAAATIDDAFAPIFSPIVDKACDIIKCGKGNCTVNLNETFGFVCECDEGWKQFHIGDHLRFLPCVIPNCTVNFSCEQLPAPTPAILPPPTNHSIFDACEWSYCGEGTCVKSPESGHRCECKTGYANLLNDTDLPCFRECSIGADCVNLGIGLTNSSSSTSPPTFSDSGVAANQDPHKTAKGKPPKDFTSCYGKGPMIKHSTTWRKKNKGPFGETNQNYLQKKPEHMMVKRHQMSQWVMKGIT
ncbi:uncharacterized protein LOC131233854 isoform X2 [Magnolia sinica]|uniref:uncharacterized protein LOC131233854 isoform X2 n=1 Tax=Magnolia sinica TaxID=86752 RepID=UPI0026580EE6|nr:uncharacterized protein LOC131233854 isoform X2 [Magnolia sinica]